MESGTSIPQRAKLSVDTKMELLTNISKTKYLQLETDFNQQDFVKARVSCLSSGIRNILTQEFEGRSICIRYWTLISWCYLDDTFMNWVDDLHLSLFLEGINNVKH